MHPSRDSASSVGSWEGRMAATRSNCGLRLKGSSYPNFGIMQLTKTEPAGLQTLLAEDSASLVYPSPDLHHSQQYPGLAPCPRQ